MGNATIPFGEIPEFAGKLAVHYLACIDEEDRRSLQLRVEDLGKRFIAPWKGSEWLLHTGVDSCRLVPSTTREADFLAKGPAGSSSSDIGYYGYPLLFDGHGRLSPLFILPVQISDLGNRNEQPAYEVHRTDEPLINRSLLKSQGYGDEEIEALQYELQSDDFGTFEARLKAAIACFENVAFDVTDSTLEPFPSEPGPRWVRTPVFVRDARGPFTFNLRQDLSAITRYDSVRADIPRTALGVLLGGSGTAVKTPSTAHVAELRPLNDSQIAAAKSAQEAPLTVITGPPGTGKSQVVVDLLATAILEQRPVLFASKNNQAVDVVRLRLREALGETLDFTLRVGSRQAMADMRPEILDRLARLEETGPPGGESEARSDVLRAREELELLQRLQAALDAAIKVEEQKASSVPEAWRMSTSSGSEPKLDLARIRYVVDEARAYSGQDRLGIVRWFKRLFRGSTVRRVLVDELEDMLLTAPDTVRDDITTALLTQDGFRPLIDSGEKTIKYQKWIDARSACGEVHRNLRATLKRSETVEGELRAIKLELSDATVRLCRAVWGKRLHQEAKKVRRDLDLYQEALSGVGGRGIDFIVSLERLESAWEQLASHFPVWITTALSVRNAIPLRPGLIDLVIVDEASQCDVASAEPLLYRARRAAVIGDPHQLKHIPPIDEKLENSLSTSAGVCPDWSYAKHSFFDVAARTFKASGHDEPLFLEEHYRSHPSIIQFSNRLFYGGRLRVQTDLEALIARLPEVECGVFWTNVRGNVPPSSRSAYNSIEIDAIIAYVGRLITEAGAKTSIGIVTPFRAQCDRLRQRVRAQQWYDSARNRLRVGTAHTFQGDECDLIIFSPVVSDGMRPGTLRWATGTEELLNVSVTRARAALHIVGDSQACLEAGGNLARLVDHALPRNAA